MEGFAKTIFITAGKGASGLLDLLLPRVCGACGSGDVAADGLCQSCARSLLTLVSLPYCPRCGTTVGPNVPIRPDGCAGCPSTLPRFGAVIRLGPYAHPLRSIIRELKYRHQEDMLRRLVQLLGETVRAKTETDSPDVVIPVPMHWRRRLVRGYDHARVLGRCLGRCLDIPLGDDLIRVRHTPPQVNLSRTKRIENVHSAFALRSTVAIEGSHVLLVDDVTTTGATGNEAARTVLSGGASRVTFVVVAKAEPSTAYARHYLPSES